MAKALINNIQISGLACALPENKIISKNRIQDFGQDTIEKIIKNTGVESVFHVSKNQTASDLAFVAADNLLTNLCIDKKEIGALILVTQTPDYCSPATAFVLQHRLGLPENCICFDINLGCPGYVNGLFSLASVMECSDIKKGLLLVAETASKRISPLDRTLALLFGDCGTATLLTKQADNSLWPFEFRSFGDRYKAIMTRGGGYRHLGISNERLECEDGNIRSKNDTYMDGLEVFYFSTSEVSQFLTEYMTNNHIVEKNLDFFVFHQANLMILKQLAKKLGVPMEKVPTSLRYYGNTSNTSIPLAIGYMKGLEVSGTKNLLLSGFGVGLSWGAVSLPLNFDYVLPIIHTGDFFTDE
jgi:3-oxoacyl-[acyl-carrier-protein] synthase-3